MFETFAAYLTEKAGLNNEELKLVKDAFVEKKLRKRQYLLQEGDVSHYNSFVAKGCLRLYRVGHDGSEHILRFAIENWWMSDYESYNSGDPSKCNIDALEDTEILLIKKESFDALCNVIPKLKAFKDNLDARSYTASQNRILSIISETAEEKYDSFMKSYPHIYSRVPLHMIAAYLGVSRETLSRIRRQYTKNNNF